MEKERQLQCFIISTSSFDTSKIREIIEEYNVSVWDAYSEPLKPGLNIVDEIQRKIRDSDFAVAIISDENPNVFYEIGLAQGIRKPVFLVLVGEKPNIPFSYFSYLKYKPDNIESFKFSFEPFIESILSKKRILRRKREPKQIKARTLSARSDMLGDVLFGDKLPYVVDKIPKIEAEKDKIYSILIPKVYKDKNGEMKNIDPKLLMNYEQQLTEKFGGVTQTDAKGTWIEPEVMEKIKDEHRIFSIYSPSEKCKEDLKILKKFAKKIADDLNQESITIFSFDGATIEVNKADFGLRRLAVTALRKTGDKRAVELLIEALRDENWLVRANAAKALGDIGDKRAVEPLILALKDMDSEVRKTAVTALGEIGDKRAVEPLISALRDKNWDVRKTIINEFKRFDISLDKKYSEELEQLRQSGYGREAENLLRDIFNDIGIIYKGPPKIARGFQPDFSLWLDSLEGILGNPVIIELKLGNLSERKLSSAENQLHLYLSKTNAKAGILLYLDRRGKQFPSKGFIYPNIIRIELSDLVRDLGELTLEEILLRERNKTVHLREV